MNTKKLTKTTINASASSLNKFSDCPRAYYYHYEQGIRPVTDPWYFILGRVYGECLDKLYQYIQKYHPRRDQLGIDRIISKGKKAALQHLDASFDKMMSLPSRPKKDEFYREELYKLRAMIEGYVVNNKKFLYDIEVLAIEEELKFVFKEQYKIIGYIDKRVRRISTNTMWLLDHKTPSIINENYIEMARQSIQFRLYVSAAKIKYPELQGLILDQTKKTKKKVKQKQTEDEYAKEIKDMYTKDSKQYLLDDLVFEDYERGDFIESFHSRLVHLKSCKKSIKEGGFGGFYQRESACNNYGRCVFHPVCWEGGLESNKNLYKIVKGD